MEPAFVEIYRPGDQQEVMLIKAALDASGIGYYITNENFNSILPVWGVGDMRLMVERTQARRCIQLLKEELGLDGVQESA